MDNQSEPTPSTSNGITAKSRIPPVTIEAANEAECHKVIAEILSNKRASREKEVFIEYTGTESMEALLPSLFKLPTEEDKEEIEKIRKQLKTLSGSNTVTVKNVIVAESLSEKDKDNQETNGDKDRQNNNIKPQSPEEVVETMYRKLVEQLHTVEGFDSEEWGAAVVDANADSIFYKSPNLETDEEKNGHFQEFLNCSGSSDRDTTTAVLGNEEGDEEQRKTEQPMDEEESNQLENFDDDRMINELANDVFEGDTDAFSFDNPYDLDGISKLPDDAITPSFVLDYVLSSVNCLPKHTDTPKTDEYLETQIEDKKPEELHQDCPEENVEMSTGDYCDNDETQPSVQESEKKISESKNLQANKIIDEDATNPLCPSPTINVPAENPSVLSPQVDATTATKSEQNLLKIKPCKILLTRYDKPSSERKVTKDKSASASTRSQMERPKSPEPNVTPSRVEGDSNRSPAKALDIVNTFVQLRKRKNAAAESESSRVSQFESGPRTSKRSKQRVNKPAQSEKDISSSAQDAKFEPQILNPKPTSQSVKEEVMITANELNNSVALNEEPDRTQASNSDVSDGNNSPPPPSQNKPATSSTNVRSGLRRKGSEPVTPPRKRKKAATPTSLKSQKLLEKIMSEEVKKPNPDLVVLSDTLARTFNARRIFIDDPDSDVDYVVQRYPALKLYPMVKVEYGRVVGNIDKMVKLERNLASNLKEALGLKKKVFRKRHPVWEEAVKHWADDKNCDHRKRLVLGMVALCFHFTENAVVTNLCRILKENETLQDRDQMNLITPTLVLQKPQLFETETEMWIYVETNKYLQVPNFYEGVLCIYAMYYVFNMVYDKKLQPLFEYFDLIIGNPQNTFKNISDALFGKK